MRRTIVAALAAIMLVGLATPAGSQTITQNSGPINAPIPEDGSSATVPLPGPAGGYLTEVRVGVRIDHPRLADLTLRLRAADGRIVLLTDAVTGVNMGSGAGCDGPLTVFRAAAATPIGTGTAPYTGEFRPQGSLTALMGMNPGGTWQLLASDGVAGMNGFVRCFSLTLSFTPGIEVTTTADAVADDGLISLREAFTIANSDGRASTIVLKPRSTYPINCGLGGLRITGAETVVLRGFGSTVTTAGCAGGTPLLSGVPASGIQVDQLNLRTTGASGPGIDFGTVIVNAVDIRGPFFNGIEAGALRGAVLSVRGAATDGVFATGTADLTRASIVGNEREGVEAATIRLTQSDVQGNRGAAVNGTMVTVTSSSLTGNVGGAQVAGNGTFAQTTIAGNSAGVGGAGRVSLDHVTVAGNAIDIAADLTGVTAKASAIGTCERAVSSLGHNAAQDAGCGLAGATDVTGPLRLGPLTGALPRVRVPLADSPLIDAIPPAACTAPADQRRVVRPQAGRCDIGAVEVRPPQARDDSYQLQRGLIWTLHVLINDLDPDGQLPGATVTIVGTTGGGRFTVAGSALRFETPSTVGPASATYRVCTLSGACSTATARVDVVAHPTPPPPTPPPGGPPPGGPDTIGYWLVEADGQVTAFGDVANLGDAIPAPGATVVAMAGRPQGDGYWVLASDGDIIAVGGALDFGAVDLGLLSEPGEVLATVASSPTGGGVWVMTTSGRIFSFGDATPTFAMAGADVILGLDLEGPVVDAAPTPTGLGIYMVGADGGVFTVGDAVFVESLRGQLTELFGPPGLPFRPVVGVVADPDGRGYWMVGEDGGVFSFDAPFRGSLPALVPFERLVAPVNGMVPYGNGYVLVAGDGGTFVFSNLPFAGSGFELLDDPVVGIATPR